MCDNAIVNVDIVLQEFHCEKSDGNGLTLNSLEMLLSECPRLKAVSDIQAWSAIEPAEVNFKFKRLCQTQITTIIGPN